jgi:glycosyltransferase involved in cell wall biosynthesis
MKFLTVLPVYNEVCHVATVLDEVVSYTHDVLVVDDGSSDGTAQLLDQRSDIAQIRHPENCGYGAALRTAFDYAILHCYDVVVTIDCDGQHEPQRILKLVDACQQVDIVSGSRYLQRNQSNGQAPAERMQINREITQELNRRLGLSLTDAFCGFKAYRTCSLARLELTEAGYGMPIELWVQAVHHGLHIVEVPVPLIYLEEKRSFGGQLDNGEARRRYYYSVLDRAEAAVAQNASQPLPRVCYAIGP